ncbi:MAG: hypothetical protein JXA20_07335 [Spirochaetes bacterium]|nr:hypothetical protein [Spirochaetota bacterium]
MKKILVACISTVTAFFAMLMVHNQTIQTFANDEVAKEVKINTKKASVTGTKKQAEPVKATNMRNKGKLGQKQLIKRFGPGEVA